MLRIRLAAPDDRAFVDATYAAIRFAPSGPGDEVLVAELDGDRVGLGRLVPIDDGTVELGGIWTDERHRRHGVAGAIIAALKERVGRRRGYCIPFAPLAGYYKRFGFVDARTDEPVPAPIADKLAFCQATYAQPVALLVLT